ncbi:MAG: NAD(P)/FAD-dependent oxidoreductase [Terriglobales bacterium]
MPDPNHNPRTVILGGGPAGLSAAFELTRHGCTPLVLETDEVVGGLARTVSYKGFLFDIGGHRFFTKSTEVQQLWQEILGSSLLKRSRLSRIYYRNRFFLYPIKAVDALLGVGPWEALRVVASYLRWHFFPYREVKNFEQYVTNHFGKRLFEMFFRTYTEKVWGIPCTEIRADWAAQRIRNLSLMRLVRAALRGSHGDPIRSLVEQFSYPERGPGQMWETLAGRLEAMGHPVLKGRRVAQVCHDGRAVTSVVTEGKNGIERFEGTHFISSIPMRDLVRALSPAPPEEVLKAAESLRYRDFLLVGLLVNREDICPDNWIYVHDPAVRVGRVQNFKNWSPAMVPNSQQTSLGMEYFVFENDDLWSSSDSQLIDLARREVEHLRLARADEIPDGVVIRMPKAYPIYDRDWEQHVATIRGYVEAHLSNLQLVGRNGMHRYNNQDHSMMTAMYAARNVMGAGYDLWKVNSEAEYQEEETESRRAPYRPAYAEPPKVTPLPDEGN